MGEDKHKKQRIAKVIARAGLCSRRDAERWIDAGRVEVNGKIINSPALNVGDNDKIMVDNKELPRIDRSRLFLYHKPPGLVTSHKDEKGRATIFDDLPEFMPRVVSVGRLDLNSEGLLLLTNDGEMARFLELPDTGWARKYRVRVHGKINEKRLKSLKNGITIKGVHYKSIDAKLEEKNKAQLSGTNSWISITLREGKNREIRRVMEELGLNVTRLIRTDYGPFSLGSMNRSAVVEVKANVIKHQLAKYFAGKSDGKNLALATTKPPKNYDNGKGNIERKNKKTNRWKKL